MSGPTDVLADLQGVVRIAKAASLGVTGNKPRIERAEQAIAAVADLIDKVDSALALGWSDTAARELRAARAHCGGAK